MCPSLQWKWLTGSLPFSLSSPSHRDDVSLRLLGNFETIHQRDGTLCFGEATQSTVYGRTKHPVGQALHERLRRPRRLPVLWS